MSAIHYINRTSLLFWMFSMTASVEDAEQFKQPSQLKALMRDKLLPWTCPTVVITAIFWMWLHTMQPELIDLCQVYHSPSTIHIRSNKYLMNQWRYGQLKRKERINQDAQANKNKYKVLSNGQNAIKKTQTYDKWYKNPQEHSAWGNECPVNLMATWSGIIPCCLNNTWTHT